MRKQVKHRGKGWKGPAGTNRQELQPPPDKQQKRDETRPPGT
jgi:hypothetical protein